MLTEKKTGVRLLPATLVKNLNKIVNLIMQHIGKNFV